MDESVDGETGTPGDGKSLVDKVGLTGGVTSEPEPDDDASDLDDICIIIDDTVDDDAPMARAFVTPLNGLTLLMAGMVADAAVIMVADGGII